mmetsp:Transcript_40956/g.132298  ORF Transcript_40956/g.132298 Transcript_40956/m.132298 type:complete len:311 (+) Transcript_40956:35-967(+)
MLKLLLLLPCVGVHARLGAASAALASPSAALELTRLPRTLTAETLQLAAASPDAGLIARWLGFLVGAGSLLLYTPIAARVYRQRSADGLTLSTWWLKLLSYTCSDAYSFRNGYPLSTYIETLIITVEACGVLLLVAHFQRRLDAAFAGLALSYLAAATWALSAAPPEAIALGQSAATALNTCALLPQIAQNAARRSPGGFSPVTAGLACAGCAIRLFTTVELAGSDPLLLAGFAAGLAVNAALLSQIVYYGAVVEGRPLLLVLAADFVAPAEKVPTSPSERALMRASELEALEEASSEADLPSHKRSPGR